MDLGSYWPPRKWQSGPSHQTDTAFPFKCWPFPYTGLWPQNILPLPHTQHLANILVLSSPFGHPRLTHSKIYFGLSPLLCVFTVTKTTYPRNISFSALPLQTFGSLPPSLYIFCLDFPTTMRRSWTPSTTFGLHSFGHLTTISRSSDKIIFFELEKFFFQFLCELYFKILINYSDIMLKKI